MRPTMRPHARWHLKKENERIEKRNEKKKEKGLQLSLRNTHGKGESFVVQIGRVREQTKWPTQKTKAARALKISKAARALKIFKAAQSSTFSMTEALDAELRIHCARSKLVSTLEPAQSFLKDSNQNRFRGEPVDM